MPHHLITERGALFVLWLGVTRDDALAVLSALEEAYHIHQRKLVYISRVPAGAPLPDRSTQVYLASRMSRVTEMCSTYHVIMEGEGFNVAAHRSLLLELFQLGRRRSTFFIHSSVDDVLARVSSLEHRCASHILAMAKAKGYLDLQFKP